MKEKYLPIGTIVMLNGGTKRVMIIGYCPMTEDKKMFDYSSCTYPEGVISSDKTLAFNHDQIVKIEQMGLEDQEYTEFNEKIKNMVKSLNTLKDVEFPQENGNNSVQENKSQNTTEIPILDINQTANNNQNQINSISDIMNG